MIALTTPPKKLDRYPAAPMIDAPIKPQTAGIAARLATYFLNRKAVSPVSRSITGHSVFGVSRMFFTRATRFMAPSVGLRSFVARLDPSESRDRTPEAGPRVSLRSTRATPAAQISVALFCRPRPMSRGRFKLSTPILDHHGGALLGDHHGRRVGVARGDGGHHRGIDHAQAIDSHHAQARIDHGAGIARQPHLGGAHGVKDRGAGIAPPLRARGT